MRRIVTVALFPWVLVLLAFLALPVDGSQSQEVKDSVAAPDMKELPPLDQCEANNYKLRVSVVQFQSEIARLNGQVAELQARLLSIEANNERTRLETKYRELLKPSDGAQFNWNTYRFDAPPPPK